MPFISFVTNHKLTLKQENEIQQETGKLISLIPNKTEKALMIHMEDDQIMYFGGQDTTCMLINISLYHKAPFEAKKAFTEAIVQMINDTTNIDKSAIYVKYNEYDEWGKQGTLVE